MSKIERVLNPGKYIVAVGGNWLSRSEAVAGSNSSSHYGDFVLYVDEADGRDDQANIYAGSITQSGEGSVF